MKKIIKASAVSILTIAIASCSGEADAPEADTVTETRMDEVDVIDGTISDDMVDVDAEKTGDELAEDEGTDGSDGSDGETEE